MDPSGRHTRVTGVRHTSYCEQLNQRSKTFLKNTPHAHTRPATHAPPATQERNGLVGFRRGVKEFVIIDGAHLDGQTDPAFFFCFVKLKAGVLLSPGRPKNPTIG